MNTIIERITEAIKDILIGLIKSCLDNMFTSVNEQVGTIAGQVGQTPQGWNAGIFNLIQNISQTVIVPIAGLIITFVLCYELITMVTQKNNFHEFETYNIFLWIFKAYVAIYLVTNTFNITMAVFDVGQHVVNNAAGVISGNTAVDATEAITRIVDALAGVEEIYYGTKSYFDSVPCRPILPVFSASILCQPHFQRVPHLAHIFHVEPRIVKSCCQ